MKKVKAIASMMVLTGVIMMGVSNAQAGMLMSDFVGGSNSNPCTETKEDGDKVDHGIIVVGLIEIFGADIVEGIIGKSDEQTNCGIIVHE